MKAEAIAKKIKLVCLDVDGVLTDGSIIISGQGELFKQFYVRDGLGIKFLQDCGIQVAICTGRQSDIVIERAKELGITLLMQGQKDNHRIVKVTEAQLVFVALNKDGRPQPVYRADNPAPEKTE